MRIEKSASSWDAPIRSPGRSLGRSATWPNPAGGKSQHGREGLHELCGTHHAKETKLIKTDDDNLAEAMTAAVGGAVRGLRLPREAVDAIYCDINGERYRSEEWGLVALRLPDAFRDATQYQAPSGFWGDVGAASGALFVTLAVQSWRRGYARGPRALLCAGSEAGLRAAVLLQTSEQASFRRNS